MITQSQTSQKSIVPLLRYRDLARAMDWLHEVFGFEKQLAVSDAEGEVVYGQMRFGASVIMLGTVRDTDLDGFMTQPDEVGGFETQTCYVAIDDAEEHFSRTVMAGADILLELKSDANGRRGYACRDPEGHIWNFGTFHPTAGALAPVSAVIADAPVEQQKRSGLSRLAMAASLMLALAAGYGARDFMPIEERMSVASEEGTADYAYQLLAVVRGEARDLTAERDRLKRDLESANAALKTAEAAAETEKAQRVSLEGKLTEAREALKAREAAEQVALKQARDAEARLEAATASAVNAQREKVSAADVQAERDAQERSAAVLQEGTRAIETSATTPPQAEMPAPAQTETPAAAKSASLRRSAAPKKTAIDMSERYRPTYMIELSDVPWPYTAWHKNAMKRH